jgi:hypothetical protein
MRTEPSRFACGFDVRVNLLHPRNRAGGKLVTERAIAALALGVVLVAMAPAVAGSSIEATGTADVTTEEPDDGKEAMDCVETSPWPPYVFINPEDCFPPPK